VRSEIFLNLANDPGLGDDEKGMDPNYIGRDLTEE
jgi:hypothetical protein